MAWQGAHVHVHALSTGRHAQMSSGCTEAGVTGYGTAARTERRSQWRAHALEHASDVIQRRDRALLAPSEEIGERAQQARQRF